MMPVGPAGPLDPSGMLTIRDCTTPFLSYSDALCVVFNWLRVFCSGGICLPAAAGKGLRRCERIGENPVALVIEMAKRQGRQGIPTNLSVVQFEQFVLPHLEQEKSRTRDTTELSRDLQLHFALALPGLPVEGAPDREGSPRPCRDPLHAHLSRLSALASGWLF